MDTSGSARTKANSLSLLIIIGLLVLLVLVYFRGKAAEKQLEQMSVRLEQLSGGNQAQNQEAARRIVDRVRKLYTIPVDVEPTVATIVDVNALRKRNAFYNKASNGNYLIVTSDRAILYDAERDVIIDVVPVQIQPEAAQTSSARS